MLVVADIDQAIVTAPIIGENHTGRIDLAAQDGMESAGRTIGHDLGVDASLSLIDAEDRLLEGAATALAGTGTTTQASRPEVAFIGFDDANEAAQLGELMSGRSCDEKGCSDDLWYYG